MRIRLSDTHQTVWEMGGATITTHSFYAIPIIAIDNFICPCSSFLHKPYIRCRKLANFKLVIEFRFMLTRLLLLKQCMKTSDT